MKWMWTMVLVCVVASFGGAASARDCPDQKATNVPPTVVESGDKETCGLGIQIFGLGGAIIGESCPKWIHLIPAHSDCFGDALLGYECRPIGTFAVQRQSCDCGGLVLPFIETGIPSSCECTDPVNSGGYITYGTFACEGTPPTSGAGGTPGGRRRGPTSGSGAGGGSGAGWAPAPID